MSCFRCLYFVWPLISWKCAFSLEKITILKIFTKIMCLHFAFIFLYKNFKKNVQDEKSMPKASCVLTCIFSGTCVHFGRAWDSKLAPSSTKLRMHNWGWPVWKLLGDVGSCRNSFSKRFGWASEDLAALWPSVLQPNRPKMTHNLQPQHVWKPSVFATNFDGLGERFGQFWGSDLSFRVGAQFTEISWSMQRFQQNRRQR